MSPGCLRSRCGASPERPGSQSRFRLALATSEFSDEKHDGDDVEEGFDGSDGGLEIRREAPISADTGEEALNYPTASMEGKANLNAGVRRLQRFAA